MNRDLYELYALGLLEEPERSQVEAELKSGDPDAAARLRSAIENNAMFLAGVEQSEPPARLRAAILQSVGPAPRQNRGWMWAIGLAAASLAVVSFVMTGRWLESERTLEQTRAELRQTTLRAAETNAELAKAKRILSVLDAPETRFVTFGPDEPKPRGQVVVNPAVGVLLIASNLPPAPAGQIYEMWVIPPKGASPAPAGLFQSGAAGNALHFHQTLVAPGSAVAVTLEPESGSEKPTTTPLFVAVL